jgi:Fe2+ or Zn2+ uptake regulation protein
MTTKKAKSFNHQVYEKAYKRLNLTSTQRNIFQRLLGFLIRNNKSFPYSAVTMSELTGFSLSTIFRSLDQLETYRLIRREGLGKNRRFRRGSILDKILTTVSNRNIIEQVNNSTTVSWCDKNSPNRVMVTYSKTSSFSKRKEGVAYASGSNSNPLSHQELKEIEHCMKNNVPLAKEFKYLQPFLDKALT